MKTIGGQFGTKIVNHTMDGDICVTHVEVAGSTMRYTIREELWKKDRDYVLCFGTRRLDVCRSLRSARRAAITHARANILRRIK